MNFFLKLILLNQENRINLLKKEKGSLRAELDQTKEKLLSSELKMSEENDSLKSQLNSANNSISKLQSNFDSEKRKLNDFILRLESTVDIAFLSLENEINGIIDTNYDSIYEYLNGVKIVVKQFEDILKQNADSARSQYDSFKDDSVGQIYQALASSYSSSSNWFSYIRTEYLERIFISQINSAKSSLKLNLLIPIQQIKSEIKGLITQEKQNNSNQESNSNSNNENVAVVPKTTYYFIPNISQLESYDSENGFNLLIDTLNVGITKFQNQSQDGFIENYIKPDYQRFLSDGAGQNFSGMRKNLSYPEMILSNDVFLTQNGNTLESNWPFLEFNFESDEIVGLVKYTSPAMTLYPTTYTSNKYPVLIVKNTSGPEQELINLITLFPTHDDGYKIVVFNTRLGSESLIYDSYFKPRELRYYCVKAFTSSVNKINIINAVQNILDGKFTNLGGLAISPSEINNQTMLVKCLIDSNEQESNPIWLKESLNGEYSKLSFEFTIKKDALIQVINSVGQGFDNPNNLDPNS